MQKGSLFKARFELLSRAGEGGMGTVWRALDRATGQPVALKLLRHLGASDTARFRHEARILSGLSHPHVVRYIAHEIEPTGEPYLVMEWLEGETLADRLDRVGLQLDESLSLVRQVASALAAVHARGIVHRDIKPNNLLLVDGQVDHVKVLDFGIARQSGATSQLTKSGSILGTPGYMAPEQARGDREMSPSADVFALGCILFECLTGKRAFQGDHPIALLAKLLFEEPPRLLELQPDTPAALADLVARMLAKDPSERPADGAAVLAAVEALAVERASRRDVEVQTAARAITRMEQRIVSIVAVGAAARAPTAEAETMPIDGAPRHVIEAVRRAAVPLGARVEELANGVVVAVLLGEGSATDQAAAAARCALWVRVATDATIVLVTGRGASTNRLPVGEALERAAALLDQPDQLAGRGAPVRIDDVTRALLDPRFLVVEEAGHILLQVERRIGDEPRTLLGRPSPFVGRDREVRSVVDIVEESFDERRPAAVLVTGLPGMGKSRLRQEITRVIREHHADVAITMARPDAIGAGSSFVMLAESLRNALEITAGEPLSTQREKVRLLVSLFYTGEDADRTAEFLGELTGTPFPDDDSPRLRAARQNPNLMADQIETAYVGLTAAVASTRPVLLVLEDLHWGDAPSVKIINAALRELDNRPFAVIAFARPSVHEVFPHLWAGRNVHEIRLNPLSRRAATEMVERTLGATVDPSRAAALVERSEGNAFYLEELIRAVAEGRGEALPDTVLGMVETRLAALTPEARRLLRAASVFGEVFWKGGVSALLGEDRSVDASLERLCADELITRRLQSRFAGEEEFALRHALLREGAYAMLAERDRALGHRLAGEWLSRAGERDPVVMAEHFERGGEGARAADFYRMAAEQALRGLDHAAARSRAERGVACGASAETVVVLRLIQADACLYSIDHARAYELASQALAAAEPGSANYCRALACAFATASFLGRADALGDVMQRVAELDPHPSGILDAVTMYHNVSYMLLLVGVRDAAYGYVQRIERIVAQTGAGDMELRGWLMLVRAAWSRHAERDPFGALSYDQAALRCFEVAGDRHYGLTARVYADMNRVDLGALEEAEQNLTRLLAAERMSSYHRSIAAYHLSFALLQSGKYAKAISIIEASLREAAETRDRIVAPIMSIVLGAARLRAGELASAEEAIRDLGDPSGHAMYISVPLRIVLAEIRLAQGQPVEAARLCREAIAQVQSTGISPGMHELDLPLIHALALLRSGDVEGARAALRAEREDIFARAAAIPDARYRQSFLEGLPTRARLLALAREQLDM